MAKDESGALARFGVTDRDIEQALGRVNLAHFERLAIATAHARAKWVAAAVKASEGAPNVSAEQCSQLSALRQGYEELSEAYEALRRMVARGYLAYQPKA